MKSLMTTGIKKIRKKNRAGAISRRHEQNASIPKKTDRINERRVIVHSKFTSRRDVSAYEQHPSNSTFGSMVPRSPPLAGAAALFMPMRISLKLCVLDNFGTFGFLTCAALRASGAAEVF